MKEEGTEEMGARKTEGRKERQTKQINDQTNKKELKSESKNHKPTYIHTKNERYIRPESQTNKQTSTEGETAADYGRKLLLFVWKRSYLMDNK